MTSTAQAQGIPPPDATGVVRPDADGARTRDADAGSPASAAATTAPATPGAAGNTGSTPNAPEPGVEATQTVNGQGATGPSSPFTPVAPPEPAPASVGDRVGDLALGSAGARAAETLPMGMTHGGFVDTRLTWTFGDDDFLNPTGALVPLSPKFNIGDRPQYRLFFDNLNSRFAGRENLTHLVMYNKTKGFIPNLTTEAALVLRFDLAALASNSGNLNSALYDSGSYIRVFYKTAEVIDAKGHSRESGVSAVFFPLDTDRMRLGYLYDISWGGTDPRINESIFPRIQGASPGFKLQYDLPDRFYGFVGFKTATIVQPVQVLNQNAESDVETVRVGETNYGVLGGLGVDITPHFRFDVGSGYFQQGKFDLEDVRGKSVYTYGGSGRMVFHRDMPVPQSVDFRLYRNDPSAPMILFAPTKYDPNEVAYSVSAESSVLRQNLKDFDVSGATKEQTAIAAALQGVLVYGYSRVSLTGIYRDLNFVVRNVPGFIPFESLPQNTKTDPELFGAAAVSHYFSGPRLTPELGAGLQLPATFKSVFSDAGIPSSRTIVVRRQGDESILPYGAERKLIFQGRVSLKWTLSEALSAVAWSQLVYDNNGTLVVRDPTEGTASLRIYQKPARLGAGIALQARF